MLEVLNGGPQTTVQDLGRPGYLHTGMHPPAPSTASPCVLGISWSGTIRAGAIWSAAIQEMPGWKSCSLAAACAPLSIT
jgi:hypothetical protein